MSKEHLDIKYDRRRGGFVAIDRGSRNGTFLNENRLSKVSCRGWGGGRRGSRRWGGGRRGGRGWGRREKRQ